MPSKLKERLARLAPRPAARPIASGSPVTVVLRPAARLSEVKTISAIEALAPCAASTLKAKRAIERMVEQGEAVLRLDNVPCVRSLARDLAKAGVALSRVGGEPVDVAALRHKLDMTQEQFALTYNLGLDAVQNWECGRRKPDPGTENFLRVIAADPDLARRALEDGV